LDELKEIEDWWPTGEEKCKYTHPPRAGPSFFVLLFILLSIGGTDGYERSGNFEGGRFSVGLGVGLGVLGCVTILGFVEGPHVERLAPPKGLAVMSRLVLTPIMLEALLRVFILELLLFIALVRLGSRPSSLVFLLGCRQR
jgi:hypothetical protein